MRFAALRTEESDARSSGAASVVAPGTWLAIRSAASRAFASLREVSTTVAPCAASSLAVSKPMPLLAPVTTATLPAWLGIPSTDHVLEAICATLLLIDQ